MTWKLARKLSTPGLLVTGVELLWTLSSLEPGSHADLILGDLAYPSAESSLRLLGAGVSLMAGPLRAPGFYRVVTATFFISMAFAAIKMSS